MARCLVTGGAGCIGSDLAQALLDRGDVVTVIDDLSSGKIEHVQPMLSHERFHWIEADLLNRDSVDAAVKGQDAIYHLAANPDVKFNAGDRTDKDLQQNTLVTYGLLESARQHNVKNFVFASTSAIYGIHEKLPITEEHPPLPISLYGASKLGCEGLILAFQHLFEMQVWIFRFANIVGPKVRKRGRTVISDFIAKLNQDPTHLPILGNGKQAKSYLRSDECVAAMMFAVENAQQPVNIFNLGCDDSLSVVRIADLVCEAMGLSDVRYSFTGTEGGWPGDVPRFMLDVSRINRLGWTAKGNSEQAVRYAIESTIAALEKANA